MLVLMGYPIFPNRSLWDIKIAMSRDPKQIEAEKRYAPKRSKKPVSFRLDDEDMAALDRARGPKSRGDYVLGLVLKAIKRA